MQSELLVQIVLSSSTYRVVLQLLPLILFCRCGRLSFYSRRAGFSVTSLPGASACRTAICSSSLFPGSMGTSPAPRSTRALLLSFTRSVSAILSLYAFILAFPVKEGSLNDRSDSLSAFIVMWLCRSSMRCKRRKTRTTSSVSVSFNVRRQERRIFQAQPPTLFQSQSLEIGVPLVLCQL